MHKHRKEAESWWEEAKSTKLRFFEDLLEQSNGPWLTGDCISIGDIALFEFLWDGFERQKVREKRIGDLEGYERLKSFCHKFLEASPGVKAYIDTRPIYAW